MRIIVPKSVKKTDQMVAEIQHFFKVAVIHHLVFVERISERPLHKE